MTMYGSQPRNLSAVTIAQKAHARRELLQRIRRQRAMAAANLRQKLLRSKHDDI